MKRKGILLAALAVAIGVITWLVTRERRNRRARHESQRGDEAR